ncbi:hypothetical protein [Dermatobacter hominis]|uniref:hypothetical protein n=1 Tax=Dermatobacter hominis TaxID=2884263 RepID=UPI001D129953|nr:hypothetical protein [Dermatobacter hominis]UDY35169.1 hypothetical protein LH044_17740 [Dermatobacter hominis]
MNPTDLPEDDHLVAHVRQVLAEGQAHRLSVRVEVDGDAVVLRGPVESDAAHRLVLDEVRAALTDAPRDLRIVDELHVPILEDRPPEAIT